jgi:hypothetical protein
MGGEGGTGKTRVINAIESYFKVNSIEQNLLLSAPTGAAAVNINGTLFPLIFMLFEKE